MIKDLCQIIPTNADLIIHSSIKSLGHKVDINELLNSLVKLLGAKGNILMPTFSFSFKNTRFFSVTDTIAETGILPEIFRTKIFCERPVIRTENPMQSIAVWGSEMKEYSQPSETAFSQDSPFQKFLDRDGYIVLIGVDYNKTSFYHLVEEVLEVPYRFWKTFKGKVVGNSVVYQEYECKMFVRDLKYMPNINHYGLLMEELGLVNKAIIGSSVVRVFKVRDLYNLLHKEVFRDPYSIVCTCRETFKVQTSTHEDNI